MHLERTAIQRLPLPSLTNATDKFLNSLPLLIPINFEMQVEAAYDLLLMQNMKARLSGEMNVKNSVRFADVPTRKSVKQVCLRPIYIMT
jgi:hypothetical protein